MSEKKEDAINPTQFQNEQHYSNAENTELAHGKENVQAAQELSEEQANISNSNNMETNSSENNSNQSDDPEDSIADDPSFLPAPLIKFRQKQYFLAALLGVGGIISALVLRSFGPLVLFVATGYYIHNGFSIKQKYHSKQIVEATAICSGARPATMKERVMVTFREEQDDGHFFYHKFFVPGKNSADDFIINAPYVIYYDKTNPNYLIASIVI